MASLTGFRSYMLVVGVGLSAMTADGRPDLAVANFNGNSVSVLRNNCNGTFAARTDYATGVNSISVAIGDLDGETPRWPLLDVPVLRQFDPQWGDVPYAGPQYDEYLSRLRARDPQDEETRLLIARLEAARPFVNLRNKACLLTAYAMAFRATGVDPGATPVTLQNALESHPGGISRIDRVADWYGPNDAVPSMDGANVDHAILSAVYPEMRSQLLATGETASLADAILRSLRAGSPVLLNSGGGHWLVARGVERGPGGVWRVTVVDPGHSAGDGVRDLASLNVVGARSISRGAASGAGAVQANCPVRVRLVDAGARTLEFDASAGIITNTFPTAALELVYPIGLPDVVFDASALERYRSNAPMLVLIDGLATGVHIMAVEGVADGQFQINFSWPRAGSAAGHTSVSGDIREGEVREFRLPVNLGCAADWNADGFLDFFDYEEFVLCYEGVSCADGITPDFNGDGFADFFDYDDFVGAFEIGC